jgi:penicillin-binding protein 2
MNAFGLGTRLGVDLPSEDKANIPDSSDYNKEYRGSWNSCTNLTLGIGQDRMTATPLQLANTMCLIANKGYYYLPHFVKEIVGETKEDTILNRYREKHEVLTHISDTAYNAVMKGMNDVVVRGTATGAAIPGINICAKTGTAENYRILDGKRVKLDNNSVFVAFAPMENPKIAIAVVVENAGYGATWAAPIASLLIEKYLTDSIRSERLPKVEEIANKNLMPSWLPREQFRTDSVRAYQWFKITNDSNYIRKYLKRGRTSQQIKKDTTKTLKPVAPPPIPQREQNDTTPVERYGFLRWDLAEPRKLMDLKTKRSAS